jgi:hypothetical protein
MADPRRYNISILENYSDKSLHEIAIVVTESIFYIKPDEFILGQTKNLALGTEFLYTEEPITWREAEKDVVPAFRDFPDVCFCLSVSGGEDGGQYRTLFFNGKSVTQYPEIRYEEFRPNDFEYQASGKAPLESAKNKAEEVISHACNKIAASMTEEHDPELLGLIRQNLFGDIILENRQDA